MKRRTFIRSTLAATAGSIVGDSLLSANSSLFAEDVVPSMPQQRVVDTHTHFYDPTRPEGVPWPPPGSPLHRTVMPADWRAVAMPVGVRETIVVEASPWVEDNQWLLDIAAEDRSILGIVGQLDPRSDQFEANVERFAANQLFCGVRWRSDLIPLDRDFGDLVRAAKQLADADLQLDLNGPCTTLPGASRLAAAVPELRIVINHLGGSGDPKSIHPSWHNHVAEIASHPNVSMKVSALVEQVAGPTGTAPHDVEYYLPILDHLWKTFGEDRLIYGSNWPVSDRGASYATVFGIVKDYFTAKGAVASEKYFWKNAAQAYRWSERSA